MPLAHPFEDIGVENSEFGIRNSEFPTALLRGDFGFRVSNFESPPVLSPYGGGEMGFQNSKFKIQNSALASAQETK